jgi:hypothetical protein
VFWAWFIYGSVMLSYVIRYLIVAVAWLGLSSADAATYSVNQRSIPGVFPGAVLTQHVIRMSGPMLEGDTERLRGLLMPLRRSDPEEALATVELNSPGGDLLEGMKMGYLLREFDVATVIRKGDICLSACALAFLGGTRRHASYSATPSCTIEYGGHVAFHNFSLNAASLEAHAQDSAAASHIRGFDEARGGAARIVRYAADMGIDPGFIAHMLGRPPEEFDYVDTVEKYLVLHACPFNLKRPPVSVAAQATNLCNHAVGGETGGASPARAEQMSARHARLRLLQHLQGSLASANLRGSLAAELAAVLASRDDRLIEAVYAELSAAGVALPELVGQQFEVAGYRVGGRQATCFVSMSLDNSDKYDVVVMDRKGFTRATLSAPARCERLLIYDGEDVINPRP